MKPLTDFRKIGEGYYAPFFRPRYPFRSFTDAVRCLSYETNFLDDERLSSLDTHNSDPIWDMIYETLKEYARRECGSDIVLHDERM